MIRAVLFTLSCVALVGLSPSVSVAAQDHNLLLVQYPGAPGPPVVPPGWQGAPPGWPGPAPAPEWLAHEQQCEVLTRHLRHIRHRLRRTPPPLRGDLAVEGAETESRLRRECWGP